MSDDEDDTHPNIDTPSLFRWRHQARVDRMEKEKEEKAEFQKGYNEWVANTCLENSCSIDCDLDPDSI